MTKTPGDLNHKLTIKNVQLTPRSIEDRWNRPESARPARAHTIVGGLFTATAGARQGRAQGGRPGEKGENSREVGSNREGLIPLDCVPYPATSARASPLSSSRPRGVSLPPPPPAQPLFPLYYNRRRWTRKCAGAKGALFFSARNREPVGIIWLLHARTHAHILRRT